MTEIQRIGILGGGAWGTALAQAVARSGHATTLWAREAEVVAAIVAGRENTPFLPGIALDPAIRATASLGDLAGSDAILLVAPAQHLRAVTTDLAKALGGARPPVVLCAKGIETGSGALMTEVAAETLPDRPQAVLSGPTFAAEVARGLPTAVTPRLHR